MGKKEKALKLFRDHFNCSQSVFTAFGTENGLTEDQCLKASCGFGGGTGRLQLTCGALNGAVMALGMKYGKSAGDPEDKKVMTYEKVRKLFSEFQKLHGTATCRELLDGYDLNDPADHEKIVQLGLFELKCEKYISDSVAITEELVQ